MSFLISIGLVIVAAVSLVVGFSMSSSILFLVAALTSAAAVVILWRRSTAERERTFVSNPPARRQPKFEEPLLEPRPKLDDEGDDVIDLGEAHTIGVPGYDHLVAAEILPSLETLSVEQLRAVIARERSGLRRGSILQRAQRLIELTGEVVEPERSLASSRPTRTSLQRGRSKDSPDFGL